MRLPSRVSAPLAGALALAWALAGCSSSSSAGDTVAAATVDGVQRLEVEAFAALSTASSTILLDVRTPEEFATGHLQNARLMNFEAADFDAQLATLDKQATYALYCRSGNRSGHALERMQAAGFTHVSDLEDGIIAWTAAGRPVITN